VYENQFLKPFTIFYLSADQRSGAARSFYPVAVYGPPKENQVSFQNDLSTDPSTPLIFKMT
jgi:hypothetical protein